MEFDLKTKNSISKVKQELLDFRDGKTRNGRIIPVTIRNEVLKFRHSGWSVMNLEKEFGIASSAIYRWLAKSQIINSTNTSTIKLNNTSKQKKLKNSYQAPKLLKLVQGLDNENSNEKASCFTSQDSPLQGAQELIMLELRSGVKIQLPQKLINLDFLKSLNSL